MIVALANSDLLTMVQWTKFTAVSQSLAPICVKETFRAPTIVTVRRARLPLTLAAEFLLDLLRCNVAKPRRPHRQGGLDAGEARRTRHRSSKVTGDFSGSNRRYFTSNPRECVAYCYVVPRET